MGFAYYIAVDREDVDFDPFVNGKAIARDADELNTIASRLGVRPLGEFVQVTAEDFANTFGNEEDAGDLPTEATWYDADELLRTVRALTEHLKQQPAASQDSHETLVELAEYEHVLVRAQATGVRVRLAIDA